MKSVAENLKSPFVAAIMLDVIEADISYGPSPSDEMLSIAPLQEGFMGLETTYDEQGRWISISYWRDETCVTRWQNFGVNRIADQFEGLSLDKACKFRISKIDDDILISKPLIAEKRAIPSPTAKARIDGFVSKVLSTFPAIAELFGYEHAR